MGSAGKKGAIGPPSRRSNLRWFLGGVLTVIVLGGLLFTPVGGALAWGVGALWRGFLNLPGIAWAREQMAQSGTLGQGSGAAPTPVGSAGSATVRTLLDEGRTLQEQGSYDEALKRFKRALDLDEGFAATHVALAALYMQMDRTDEALREMERAAELAPDNSVVLAQLGGLYAQGDDYDKAIVALERAKDLDPTEPRIASWLGAAYHDRSYVDAQRSVEELERAVKLAPSDPDNHYHLASAYVRRDDEGDKEKAVRALLRTLELDPERTEAYYSLGQLYMGLGQRQPAVSAWKHYVAVSQDAESVAQVRAWLKELGE